jgi:hypothetical protein
MYHIPLYYRNGTPRRIFLPPGDSTSYGASLSTGTFFCAGNSTICKALHSFKDSAPCTVFTMYGNHTVEHCMLYTAFFCAGNSTICTALPSFKDSAPCTVFRHCTAILLLNTVHLTQHSSLLGKRCYTQRSLSTKKSTPFTFDCTLYSI